MSQRQYLLSNQFKVEKEFGGAHLKRSHAKKPRPVSLKSAMHLTLRSSKARGSKSFLATRARRVLLDKKINEVAAKFGVKIYNLAIVGNHIHMLLRVSHRRGFISFIRSITGIIARIALGAQRGSAKLSDASRFWDQRPWTRVVSWNRDFNQVKLYVMQNFNEALGFIPYKPRFRHSATERSFSTA